MTVSAARATEPVATTRPQPTSWAHVARAVLALSVLLVVVVTAFVWPASRSAVHDLPLAVGGPAAAVQQAAARLEAARPGAFEVVPVADDAAAREAVREREVYGAIVLSGTGSPTVYVASAASPVAAQAITEVARALRGDAPPPVTDLAPATADDPRGAGLGSAALPLVLAGLLSAALATLLVRGAGRKLATVLGTALVGGLAVTAALQVWLGVLDGSLAANTAVLALGIAAVGVPIAGLAALIGPAGIGLGAATMVLLGNPFSGAASAPEMLPGGWGEFGALLPPGATGSLLRSVAFFDGASAGRPVTVLTTWLAAGLLLLWAGSRRHALPPAHAATAEPA